MQLYRICPKQYLQNYAGIGASYRDGARWNQAGQPVLYFALSAATALLEMSNYLPSPRLVPKSYHLGVYQVDESTKFDTLEPALLPKDWAQYPYPKSTQLIGNRWLLSARSLGLIVPSTAVPLGLDSIMVINPLHPDIKKIRLQKSSQELFNKRSFIGL